MTFEAALKAHLQADAGVTALVADRIYPVIRPQGKGTPAVTYHRIAGVPATDLDGLDGNLIEIRLQIDCYSESFETARQLSEAVRTRLQTAATSFYAITNLDQDFFETDTRLYRTALDCTFFYRIS